MVRSVFRKMLTKMRPVLAITLLFGQIGSHSAFEEEAAITMRPRTIKLAIASLLHMESSSDSGLRRSKSRRNIIQPGSVLNPGVLNPRVLNPRDHDASVDLPKFLKVVQEQLSAHKTIKIERFLRSEGSRENAAVLEVSKDNKKYLMQVTEKKLGQSRQAEIHPNLVPLEDGFETLNVSLVEIDAVMATSLQKQLRQEDIISILMQLLGAVRHLHNQDILHRDIRLENMWYDPQKRYLKLLWPGLGSPEKINMQPEFPKYDKASDMWGVGMAIFRLVTGTQISLETNWLKSQIDIDKRIKASHFELKNYDEETTNAIKTLLLQALKLDPSKRITAEQALRNPLFRNVALDMFIYELGKIKRLKEFVNKLVPLNPNTFNNDQPAKSFMSNYVALTKNLKDKKAMDKDAVAMNCAKAFQNLKLPCKKLEEAFFSVEAHAVELSRKAEELRLMNSRRNLLMLLDQVPESHRGRSINLTCASDKLKLDIRTLRQVLTIIPTNEVILHGLKPIFENCEAVDAIRESLSKKIVEDESQSHN